MSPKPKKKKAKKTVADNDGSMPKRSDSNRSDASDASSSSTVVSASSNSTSYSRASEPLQRMVGRLPTVREESSEETMVTAAEQPSSDGTMVTMPEGSSGESQVGYTI